MIEFSNYAIASLTLMIVSIGLFITLVEKIATYRFYENGNLLGWDISKYRYKWTHSSWTAKLLDYLLNQSSFKWVIVCSIFISALGIFNFFYSYLSSFISFGLMLYMILYFSRNLYGTDGADQMNFIILVSLSFFGILKDDSIVKDLPLYFIAVQLSISYLISGYAKLISTKWRSGEAIVGILSANAYGDKSLSNFLKENKAIAKAICWFTISFECIWVIIFFIPEEFQMVFIVLGLMFHLSIAFVMGLNNFLFSFYAAYPSLYYALIKF